MYYNKYQKYKHLYNNLKYGGYSDNRFRLDDEYDQNDDESKLQKQEQLKRKYGSNWWLKQARKRFENKKVEDKRFRVDGLDNFKLEPQKAINNGLPFESNLINQRRILKEKTNKSMLEKQRELKKKHGPMYFAKEVRKRIENQKKKDKEEVNRRKMNRMRMSDVATNVLGRQQVKKRDENDEYQQIDLNDYSRDLSSVDEEDDDDDQHINLDDYSRDLSSGDEEDDYEEDGDAEDDTSNKFLNKRITNSYNKHNDNRVNKFSWEKCESDQDCPSYTPKCDLKNNICIEQKEIPIVPGTRSLKKRDIGIPPQVKNRMNSLIEKALKARKER
jgi:hypothetical protein